MIFNKDHYWFSLICSIFIYTISTALSLPVASILSLTIGFVFGLWVGLGIILFSATIGATLVFLATRYVVAGAVYKRFGERTQKILLEFKKNDFNYLLFLRLVPIFPFWLINLAMAFTPIKVHTYMLATLIGILPGAFVFTNLGRVLGQIDSPNQILSPQTLTAFSLLSLFVLVPIFVKKIRSKL
ncbi:MAG: TVP38/TMEM64 family protein [Thermodesulfobacteriota bacterium]